MDTNGHKFSSGDAELRYTLEVARTLQRTIDGVSASQERTGRDLAFDRALKRGREAIIAMLHAACDGLAPVHGEEIGRFLRALEYGEIPEGEFFNQPAETSNPAAGSAKPKKSAEMGARGKMLGGIKPARVSLKTRVKEQGRVKLRHASSSHAAKDVMDGRARDTGAHTDRKPARASRVKPAAAGHAASANGRESIPLPGSVVPENLDAWLEQKSQEVMAQWR